MTVLWYLSLFRKFVIFVIVFVDPFVEFAWETLGVCISVTPLGYKILLYLCLRNRQSTASVCDFELSISPSSYLIKNF